MYLEKLEELSKFLVVNDSKSDEICRFLNFEIFSYFRCRAVYFARLGNEGVMTPVGQYGFPDSAIAAWGDIPMTLDIPITKAASTNTCVQVDSHKELIRQFPSTRGMTHLDTNWASMLSIPIHAYGAFTLVSYENPELDDQAERFLRTVGQLASIGFAKSHLLSLLNSRRKIGRNYETEKLTLTTRQESIKKMITRGMTNIEIGNELGFSESLIRQETMAIYAALGVSGRKELIAKAVDD
jgi:DNA-binding CsgD family transcriptional regulator